MCLNVRCYKFILLIDIILIGIWYKHKFCHYQLLVINNLGQKRGYFSYKKTIKKVSCTVGNSPFYYYFKLSSVTLYNKCAFSSSTLSRVFAASSNFKSRDICFMSFSRRLISLANKSGLRKILISTSGRLLLIGII